MAYRSDTQPLCRYCGKPIRKRTEVRFVRDPRGGNMLNPVEGPLHSREECQRAVNGVIVSVRYHEDCSSVYGEGGRETGAPRLVSHFSTWDGESYEDQFFCTGPCRERFANLMAQGGHCTRTYNDAIERQRKGGGAVRHPYQRWPLVERAGDPA